MRRKPIIALAVAAALLLLISVLFVFAHQSAPAVTIRQVKSVQSADITTMTFEITNHTGDAYSIFNPLEVQTRNSNGWTTFQGFEIAAIYKSPTIRPMGVISYTVSVTNLPKESVVRVLIRPRKMLLGFNGFVRRAELNLENCAQEAEHCR